MISDVHAHAFPARYYGFMRQAGGLTRLNGTIFDAPSDILAERLAHMDDAGVTRQLLSPAHAPYFTDAKRAIEAAQLANDDYAALVQQAPGRLGFWLSLPLPHIAAALEELARGYDTLGAVGVTMMCSCLDKSIAQPEFDPIYGEINRRKGVVFLHPCQNGLCSPLLNDWGLTTCAGASMEDSVAVMHLIARQVPTRFPNIRFVIPHLGGILPVLLERLDGQMPQQGFAEKPSVTARRFYYDSVGWGSKAAMLAAVAAFGADRIVPGSDYPFLLAWESYRQTFRNISEAGVPPDDAEHILNRSVAGLFAT